MLLRLLLLLLLWSQEAEHPLVHGSIAAMVMAKQLGKLLMLPFDLLDGLGTEAGQELTTTALAHDCCSGLGADLLLTRAHLGLRVDAKQAAQAAHSVATVTTRRRHVDINNARVYRRQAVRVLLH